MKNLKLVYSKEFAEDLREVVEHIKKDSLRAAKIFESNVRKRTRPLKEFPEMGKIPGDFRLGGIRILVIGNYLVLYEVKSEDNQVYLHGFCHGARDYASIFKELNS